MGWLADWLWRSASKNRLQASFLILSQSLCFSQNYWCMSGLEKQRGKHQKCFWSAGLFFFFVGPQLNVSTWILIGTQPPSARMFLGDFCPDRSIERADTCRASQGDYTLSVHRLREPYGAVRGGRAPPLRSCVCLCMVHVWHVNPQAKQQYQSGGYV